MVTTDPDADTLDPRELRARRRLVVLGELTEIGLGMARGVGALLDLELARRVGADGCIEPAAPIGTLAELERALGRVSRSVRLTVALGARLDAEPRARADKTPEPPSVARSLAEPPVKRDLSASVAVMQKAFVSDALTQAIQAEAPESEHESLLGDLYERLEEAEEEKPFAELPTEQLIALIGRDLGLSPAEDERIAQPWGGEADEAEHAEAAAGRLAYGPAVVEAALVNLGPVKAHARQIPRVRRLARDRSP
jgi:hypothetical protein